MVFIQVCSTSSLNWLDDKSQADWNEVELVNSKE